MTAQAIVRQLVSPGKRPITLVLRRTSSSDRSSRFVLRSRLRSRSGIAQVHGEGREIVGEARRGGREVAGELADEDPQALLGVLGTGRGIERRPVRRPHLGMETGPVGQLGQHIPEPVHGTAGTVGVGPQLLDRPDRARVPRR